jgi:hypothetical protein
VQQCWAQDKITRAACCDAPASVWVHCAGPAPTTACRPHAQQVPQPFGLAALGPPDQLSLGAALRYAVATILHAFILLQTVLHMRVLCCAVLCCTVLCCAAAGLCAELGSRPASQASQGVV